MIPKFRGLSIDENSKGEWQYGHLIEDGGRALFDTIILNDCVMWLAIEKSSATSTKIPNCWR